MTSHRQRTIPRMSAAALTRMSAAALMTFAASCAVASAQTKTPSEPKPSEPFRPAVVLLKDRVTLRGLVSEGEETIFLRYPEGTIRLRRDRLAQTFRLRSLRWPKDLTKAWADPEHPELLESILQGRRPSELNAILLRALLNPSGRSAAEAYLRKQGGSKWLVKLIIKGAADPEKVAYATELKASWRFRYGRVRFRRWPELHARYRLGQLGAYLKFPEGQLTLPTSEIDDFVPLGEGPPDGEQESFSAGLTDPEALAQHLETVDASRLNTDVVRMLLDRRGRHQFGVAHEAFEAVDLEPIWELLLVGSSNAELAELAVERLLADEHTDVLERAAFLLLSSSRQPLRHRGIRVLSTVHATLPETEREDAFSGWTSRLATNPEHDALLLALGYPDRVIEQLEALDPRSNRGRVVKLLALLQEARQPFPAEPALVVLEDELATSRDKLVSLRALAISQELEAVPRLIEFLRGHAARARSRDPVVREVRRALAALLRVSLGRQGVEDWEAAWEPLDVKLEESLEALDRFWSEDDLSARLAAWSRVAAIRVPERRIVAAALAELRVSRDPKLVAAVLSYVELLEPDGFVTRPLASLLEVKGLAHLAGATLMRLYRRPGGAKLDAWIELINKHSYLPPFGDRLPAEVWWEED